MECAQDILEELQPDSPSGSASNSIAAHADNTGSNAKNESESSLLQALGFDPVGLDALLARTGLDTPTLQVRLLELELQGQLGRLPGGLFQRVARS